MTLDRKIKVLRLAFVHYQHPDLIKTAKFLEDFGLVEAGRTESRIYYRGFGIDTYVYVAEQSPSGKRAFVGGTWAVESYEDLEMASAHPNGSAIKENDGPGGGKIVTIMDPNQFNVGFIYGQSLRDKESRASTARFQEQMEIIPNSAFDKNRQGKFRRFNEGPSPVHKLGHYGFIVPKSRYQQTLDFYLSLMNLKPSDSVFNPKTDEDTTCFVHIDRGQEYTDHHSLFIGGGPEDKPSFAHHSSFEVNDFDTQCLGHDWLRQQGWTNCWGIGRHVLGSQIFDYWFDNSGNIVEHYSDGDLVNEETPYTREPEAPHSLYIWGPNVPLGFVTGKVSDAQGGSQAGQKLEGTMPDPEEAQSARFEVTATT